MKWLVLFLAFVGMVSCRSIRYVPVETTKTDSVYFNKLVHDSIIIKDSVYVKEKGDTIYQYKYKYIYKDKSVHDTLYIERTDSVRVPYPVEAQLTRWQQIKMNTGGYALAIGFFVIIIVFARFVIKLKK